MVCEVSHAVPAGLGNVEWVKDAAWHARGLTLMKARSLDPLLNALAEKDDDHPDIVDERMPYWAELWPSAEALSSVILNSTELPTGAWIELGCGPGLPGLCAGKKGKTAGTLTDYLPEAVALAEWNVRQNELPLHVAQLDWRSCDDMEPVAWILASDVAYETRNTTPLLACFDHLLTPGGEIWFSEPGRPIAASFFDASSQAGWSREILAIHDPVTVYRLTRPVS